MRTTITTVLTATIMETSATETIMEAITAVTDTTRMVATAVVTGMGGITTAATTRADITRTTPLSSADYRFPSLSRSRASRIGGTNDLVRSGISKFDFAPQNHKRGGVRSDWDMQTDPEESGTRVHQKRMLEQIVAIPATLYFPTSIVAELNEICENLGYTPEQLVIEALKGQINYWNEFYEHVMTLSIDPEDFFWPKDPVFCLACVTTSHIISSFTRCSDDPVAFAQFKEEAPCGWSFSSLEEDEETDYADWRKTRS
jgi:hypothetical protein